MQAKSIVFTFFKKVIDTCFERVNVFCIYRIGFVPDRILWNGDVYARSRFVHFFSAEIGGEYERTVFECEYVFAVRKVVCNDLLFHIDVDGIARFHAYRNEGIVFTDLYCNTVQRYGEGLRPVRFSEF